MKLKFFLFFSIGVLFTYQAKARIKVPVGEMEVLEKVADLPHNDRYLLEPATQDTRSVKAGGDKSTPAKYFELGILYTEYVIAYIPLWTTKEPVLVLMNESKQDEYLSVPDQQLNEILKENNLDKDTLLNTGFFTKFGGKIIALVLIALIIFGMISSSSKKEKIDPKNV